MARVARQRQAGFIYLEVLIGILILAIVAGGVIEAFAATSTEIGSTRVDVTASKIAQQHLEDIHNMPYASVGVAGGNPSGSIAASQTQVVNGITYTVQTSVRYVDDPAQGQPHTYVDYKSVAVVVSPGVAHAAPVTETTLLAPPNYASISGLSTAVVTVVDAVTLQPLTGMTVTVSGGPSPTRTDVSSTSGTVVFAGLTPNPTSSSDPAYKYTVQVSQTGWATDPTTAPSVTTAHLSASQTWQVTIKVFKPTTLNVNLVDSATGQPVTNYSTVAITAPSPQSVTDSQAGTAGSYVFTTLQGQPIEPSLSAFGIAASADCYTAQTVNAAAPVGYPSATSQTFTVKMVSQGGGHLIATVVDASSGAPISGAQVQISGGQGNLSPVIRMTGSNGQASFCEAASGAVNYTVAAGATGYGAGSTSAAITNSGSTLLTIKLVAGLTGTVNLTTASSNTLVRLKASVGTYDASQYTNSSRYASFINLAAGTYTAYMATGFSSGNPIWNAGKTVTVKAGQTLSYPVP